MQETKLLPALERPHNMEVDKHVRKLWDAARLVSGAATPIGKRAHPSDIESVCSRYVTGFSGGEWIVSFTH